jgi:hypothetical protein
MEARTKENVKSIAAYGLDKRADSLTAEYEIKIRVRYADTDTMQVVYYANLVVAK